MSLDEDAVAAMVDAWAKHKDGPHMLERRLRLWELRAMGVSVKAAVAVFEREHRPRNPDDAPPSERTLYYDWAAIRKVISTIAAAQIVEVQARGAARLEWLYGQVARQIISDSTAQEPLQPSLVDQARKLIADSCELQGALDRRGVVNMNVLTPLQAWEQEHGEGAGPGPIEAAARSGDS